MKVMQHTTDGIWNKYFIFKRCRTKRIGEVSGPGAGTGNTENILKSRTSKNPKSRGVNEMRDSERGEEEGWPLYEEVGYYWPHSAWCPTPQIGN